MNYFLVSLSAIFIAYFIFMASIIGISDFAFVWPLAGFILLGIVSARIYLVKHNINLPVSIKIILYSIIIFGALIFIVVEGLIISGMRGQPSKNLDYIIILGAKVNGTTPSGTLERRIDRAYEYLTKNTNTIAILSGGQGEGEDISEGQCMYNVLVEKGISSDRLIIEDESTTTQENIQFSLDLIHNNKDYTYGIVTNNFHVYRSVAIAKKMGYNMEGIPATNDIYTFTNYMVREFFAIIKYKISGLI